MCVCVRLCVCNNNYQQCDKVLVFPSVSSRVKTQTLRVKVFDCASMCIMYSLNDVLTLSCLQSKAMRERWLLQGMAAAEEEGEARRRQLEQDEEQGRRLEELIHR